MKSSENEDWKLHAFLDWKPKMKSVECPRCDGRGEVGGGFKDIDGPRPCPDCHGSGIKLVSPTSPQPEIPPDLLEHMRRAWWDWHNKP
jgi:DnaJ-class molecular chaperone